ncbi:hypothetical protein J6590_064553 [Homalodisca vitripennis]|nr:hypothetical protein J6590_064553 [Homalodisca vitripennis]
MPRSKSHHRLQRDDDAAPGGGGGEGTDLISPVLAVFQLHLLSDPVTGQRSLVTGAKDQRSMSRGPRMSDIALSINTDGTWTEDRRTLLLENSWGR